MSVITVSLLNAEILYTCYTFVKPVEFIPPTLNPGINLRSGNDGCTTYYYGRGVNSTMWKPSTHGNSVFSFLFLPSFLPSFFSFY